MGLRIAVYTESPRRLAAARALARCLGAPLLTRPCDDYPYLLWYADQRLELRRTGRDALGPLYVDFLTGPLGYRLARERGRRQPLGRAAGLSGTDPVNLVDATAGLGRDGLLLAVMGCRVTLLERSGAIAALLSDGLERAAASPALARLVRERVRLHHTDAIQWLDSAPPEARPDVVYLDPMYPPRHKSALVKKAMRAFRELVGDDQDAAMLLESALGRARRRVVVKRPRRAPPLPGPAPTTRIATKTTRYDVYITRRR
jgi:16S rRNA (guanine1516-N2)-methyltransferase